MCGRYASVLPAAQLATIFRVAGAVPKAEPSREVLPFSHRPVVHVDPRSGERRLDVFAWGLVPHFTPDLATAERPHCARAESIQVSRLFREAFQRRRCLVPADCFYEMKTTADGQHSVALSRHDGRPLALAGVWESWHAPDQTVLLSYALITTPANADVAPYHDRMPLILEPADWAAWLGEEPAHPAALLATPRPGLLGAWPVPSCIREATRGARPRLRPPARAH